MVPEESSAPVHSELEGLENLLCEIEIDHLCCVSEQSLVLVSELDDFLSIGMRNLVTQLADLNGRTEGEGLDERRRRRRRRLGEAVEPIALRFEQTQTIAPNKEVEVVVREDRN